MYPPKVKATATWDGLKKPIHRITKVYFFTTVKRPSSRYSSSQVKNVSPLHILQAGRTMDATRSTDSAQVL